MTKEVLLLIGGAEVEAAAAETEDDTDGSTVEVFRFLCFLLEEASFCSSLFDNGCNVVELLARGNS